MTGIFIKGEETEEQKHTHRRRRPRGNEAETGVVCLQAKEYPQVKK